MWVEVLFIHFISRLEILPQIKLITNFIQFFENIVSLNITKLTR